MPDTYQKQWNLGIMPSQSHRSFSHAVSGEIMIKRENKNIKYPNATNKLVNKDEWIINLEDLTLYEWMHLWYA